MQHFTRRLFLGDSLAALMLAGAVFPQPSKAARMTLPIGLQLFSLDPELKADFEGTLQKVRQIGYTDVELVGYYGRTAIELKAALQRAGLRCESIHLRPNQSHPGLGSLAEEPDRHLSICRELGLKYVVLPGPWMPERVARRIPPGKLSLQTFVEAVSTMTEADWNASATLVSDCAARARRAGLQVLYHNGNLEFITAGGMTGFDRLLRQLDPDLVKLEFDCGWATVAGQDPVKILEAQRGRVVFAHIKDMSVTPVNTSMKINPAELGAGVVDWKALVGAMQRCGVQRAFVEQESPLVRPALESAAANYRFLESLKI